MMSSTMSVQWDSGIVMRRKSTFCSNYQMKINIVIAYIVWLYMVFFFSHMETIQSCVFVMNQVLKSFTVKLLSKYWVYIHQARNVRTE